jgi:hypothetical protein
MTRWLSCWFLALVMTPIAASAAQEAPADLCSAARAGRTPRFNVSRAADLVGTFDIALVPPPSPAADSTLHAVIVLRRPDPSVPAMRVGLADSARRVVGEQPLLWGHLSEGTQLYGARSGPPDPAYPTVRLANDGRLVIGDPRYGGAIALSVTHVGAGGFRGEWQPPPTIWPMAETRGYFCAARR